MKYRIIKRKPKIVSFLLFSKLGLLITLVALASIGEGAYALTASHNPVPKVVVAKETTTQNKPSTSSASSYNSILTSHLPANATYSRQALPRGLQASVMTALIQLVRPSK